MNPNHEKLESDVVRWLVSRGYDVPQCPAYHEAFPKATSDLLKSRYSRTALYIRTRADRIAVHKTLPIEFEFECKTSHQFEAFPFAMHAIKSRVGVRCLYVVRREESEYGFWVLPGMVLCVKIPDRYAGGKYTTTPEEFDSWSSLFGEVFPGVPVVDHPWHMGSGDPFLSLNIATDEQRHWKRVVADIEDSLESTP